MIETAEAYVNVPDSQVFNPESLWQEDILPVTSLGSGLRLVGKTIVNFTQKFADEFLCKTTDGTISLFGPDRALNDEHVNRLLMAMKRGTFRWEQLQLMVCSCKGKLYRMNGQHSAWARSYWEDAPKNLPVTLLRYKAETEEDMRQLYATIDRGKSRNKGNVINSYLYESENFPDFSKTVLRQLSEGFSLWKWGVAQGTHHDGDEISYLMATIYNGLALKIGNFIKNHQGVSAKHMKRSPVYAAMYGTFERSEAGSIDFWQAVSTGANLEADDPRLKLRNHLMQHAVNAGRGGGSYKHMVAADEMLGWCEQAWNDWRSGKPLKFFKSVKVGQKFSFE